MGTKSQRVMVLAVFVGLVLTLIGLRFWFVPSSANFTFGVGEAPAFPNLERVIALRDVWLGLLAIAFGLLREWRALALWFALGVLVCLGDASLVFGANGPALAVAFHVASGLLCAVLAVSSWQLYKRAAG